MPHALSPPLRFRVGVERVSSSHLHLTAGGLQAEVEGFNQRWGNHRGDASLVEFLALAQPAADALFGQAFAKLASQVLLQLPQSVRSVTDQL